MALYDGYGKTITIESNGNSGVPVSLDSGVRQIPFEEWTTGKLDKTTGGYTVNKTNYCLPLAYNFTIKAGEWLAIPNSVNPIDFSYMRFVNDVADGGMTEDGISTNGYIRSAVSIFEIPYDGVYTFNFYVGGNTLEEAKAAINSLTIYSAEYAANHRKELFGGQDSHDDFMRTIAHRGYCGYGVENTMPAFKQSLKRGYVAMEVDLRVTSDNIPVLSHDADFAGLTIADSMFAQLQAVTRGTGMWKATIPTFDEFLYWAKCNKVEVYLDCKDSADASIDLYYDIVKKYGMLDKVTWFGNPGYVISLYDTARVGHFSANVNTAYLTGKNEFVVSIPTNQMSEATARACIEAGGKAECYTIGNTSRETVIAMSKIGVTGLTGEKVHCQAIIESQ